MTINSLNLRNIAMANALFSPEEYRQLRGWMSCSAPRPSTQPRDPAGTPQVVEFRGQFRVLLLQQRAEKAVLLPNPWEPKPNSAALCLIIWNDLLSQHALFFFFWKGDRSLPPNLLRVFLQNSFHSTCDMRRQLLVKYSFLKLPVMLPGVLQSSPLC